MSKNYKIAWSLSKSDTANECKFKYKRTYIDKAEASTKALVLGSTAHKYQENLLLDKKASAESLQKKMAEELQYFFLKMFL